MSPACGRQIQMLVTFGVHYLQQVPYQRIHAKKKSIANARLSQFHLAEISLAFSGYLVCAEIDGGRPITHARSMNG
jgi:hypothetical protein